MGGLRLVTLGDMPGAPDVSGTESEIRVQREHQPGLHRDSRIPQSCPSPGRIGMLRAAVEGPGEDLGRCDHRGDPTAGKAQPRASTSRVLELPKLCGVR